MASSKATRGKGEEPVRQTAILDTGSTHNIAPISHLRKLEPHSASVTCANGSVSTSTVRGEMYAEIIDACNPSKTMPIVFDTWGGDELSDTLFSAQRLVDAGASIVLEKGRSYLDLKKLGGPAIRIGDDCTVNYKLAAGGRGLAAAQASPRAAAAAVAAAAAPR
jgi:hypothetical protein